MLDILAAVGTSGVSGIFGSLFGLIGSWYEKKQEIKLVEKNIEEKKIENEHELNVMKYEADSAERLAEVEAESQARLSTIDADAKTAVAELSAIEKAYGSDARKYTNGVKNGKLTGFLMYMVDFYRGIIRPSVTTYCLILITMVFFRFSEQIDMLSADQINVIILLLINTLVFLTTKSVGFWFGSRGATFNQIKRSIDGKS